MKYKFAPILAALLASTPAFAGNINAGTYGINVSTQASGIPAAAGNTNFMITGKMGLQNDMALLAGFGFGSVSQTPAGGASQSATDFGFMVGARKYFSAGDFSPFMGGRVDYLKIGPSAASTSGLSFAAEVGAEYFLNKHFSVEGAIGFGYFSADVTSPAGTAKSSFFGTNNYGLSANFYF